MMKLKPSHQLKIEKLVLEARLLDYQRKELDAERETLVAQYKLDYEVCPHFKYNYKLGEFIDTDKPSS